MRLKCFCIACLLSFATVAGASAQSIKFEDRSAAAGIETAGGGHGVAVADYDGDGWEDIYLAASEGRSVLLRNLGEGRFEDLTMVAGVGVAGNAVNPLWGDIDNDGDPDLFVGVRSYEGDSSRLFLNTGNGKFVDVIDEINLDPVAVIGSAAFGDYDNDGRIDLFLATRESHDRLYRNGNGKPASFQDMTGTSNIAGLANAIAMQATWQDYDKDGDLDLFAVHDGNLGSRFYQQAGGFPPFSDVSLHAGIQVSRSSMGIAWGDFNNDGWPDAYITNIDQGNLFKNNGDGTFEDVTASTGTGLNGMSWGTVFADFDNDGDEDLFIGNTSDFDGRPSFLYENRAGVFVNIASDAGAALSTNTYGVASGDFNNDGRVDLFVADEGGKNKLLINMTPAPGNWVTFKLEGVEHNRMAIGATLRMVAGHHLFFRTVQGGGSYCSQSSTIVHAGLGNVSRIDTLEVDWGGGVKQAFINVPVNKRLEIQEGADIAVGREKDREVADLFGLKSVYPNPFHTYASIEFMLDRARHTRVKVFDVLGREVATLVDGFLASGQHRFKLSGDRLNAGVYIVRFEAEGHVSIMAVTYFNSN